MTQGDFLMDALTAAQGRLADLLAAGETKTTVDDGFLLRPSGRLCSCRAAPQLHRMNVAAIDELVVNSKASPRSALCAAALRYYLADATVS
ncbi:hypothetical protein BJF86_13365 [Serinicoccus sp. CNJ-927]|uniref:hypothetical protein n=1 Tax=Serinicoccus sp. CNJ-927 TaxID=1904970 RepID=UPI00095A083F|nr:hypothetical protein [Serinicoccus sp. CNJ-927]OLT43943.1 hypothetical protein BJF86_13365 [Serinicoccus sp. CNJ-927]